MPDPETSPRPVPEVALLAPLGAASGLLAWWAWGPTTRSCNSFNECLGRPMSALFLTLVLVVVVLVALRLLRVRPTVVSGLLGVGIGGALVTTVEKIFGAGGTPGLAPWWAWTLVGAAALPAGHALVQERTSWPVRFVVLVTLTALVWAGHAWAANNRHDHRVDELTEIGVDPVLIPDLEGYSRSRSWTITDPDGRVSYISLQFRPQGARQDFPNGYLMPIGDWEPCELTMTVERSAQEGECTVSDGRITLEGEFVQGAGVVRDGTFLLVTGRTGRLDLQVALRAVDEATEGTIDTLAQPAD